jgi:iron complex transport system substrate-binding protein
MRIVSMLSSATEIVYALGLESHLVAISHECDHPPEALSLPRASRSRFDPAGLDSGEIDRAVRRAMEEHGSVYEVDVELIRELRPDLILTQAVCEVCAVPTGSVEDAIERLDHAPRVLSLDTHTLDEIIEAVESVGEAAGAAERGREVANGLRARLDRVRRAVADEPRPRTLLLEWLDPPFAPGHWVPEMIEMAGGENLVGRAGHRSEQIDWSALDDLDPDVLLIEPCGYDLVAAREDADRHRTRIERIAERALRKERSWLLHSSFYSRSGPRVVDGVEALAGVLHPGAVPDPSTPGRAERWS